MQAFFDCNRHIFKYILVVMPIEKSQLLRTRTTLIHRLKDWNDQVSWQVFFDMYEKFIFCVARQSGLNEAEADDVVQETMISVAKHMPGFDYKRSSGSFKTWLMNMARWRIKDQFRRRRPACILQSNEEGGTTPLEGLQDPSARSSEALWEEQWKENLFEAAIKNTKRLVDPQHYQIFHLYVRKEWEPAKVAQKFGISVNQVYLTKHRVVETIQNEVGRLMKAAS
jgi:RNA polymerase sigma-70 factor (ECF subfamily)